jgi:hypothetical protein
VRLEVTSGVATLNGTTLVAQLPGTVVIQASQDGDTTFEAAPPAMQTVMVNAGPNPAHVP